MRLRLPGTGWIVAGVLLAPILVVAGGVMSTTGATPSAPPAPALAPVGAAEASGDPAAVVTALQQRLERLPGDYSSWAALGQAYLATARRTADPSYYELAVGAFETSMDVRPEANADALAGLAAVANARHDFASGRDLAQQAVDADAFDATAHGVLGDALVGLGDYDGARTALQAMADLRPGVPAMTRVSYLYELQGDHDNARQLLERALAASGTQAEAAYALQYLGRLALSEGDYRGALAHFQEGVRRDPADAEQLAGRAAAYAALGDTTAALADYETVVQRLPQPVFVVEYAELLDAAGRPAQAEAQYAVADAARSLFDAAGVVPDVEVALFEADHGDPDRAVEIAQSHAARQDSVEVQDALAWSLHAAGRDAEALEHAVAAQRLGTRNALWDYHRGMIQLKLGLVEDARASLRLSLETSPSFSPLHAPVARDALAGIEAG